MYYTCHHLIEAKSISKEKNLDFLLLSLKKKEIGTCSTNTPQLLFLDSTVISHVFVTSPRILIGRIMIPPRNHGGVVFSMQLFRPSVCYIVCVIVCVCLSVSLSVNNIQAERMHQLGCGFPEMVAYRNGLNLTEIVDL